MEVSIRKSSNQPKRRVTNQYGNSFSITHENYRPTWGSRPQAKGPGTSDPVNFEVLLETPDSDGI